MQNIKEKPVLYSCLNSALVANMQNSPEITFIEHANRKITYSMFFKDVCKVNNLLHTLKLSGNIGILCDNSYEFVLSSFGVIASLNTSLLIPSSASAQQIKTYIDKFDLNAIICDDVHEKTLADIDILTINCNSIFTQDMMLIEKEVDSNLPAVIIITLNGNGLLKGALLSHKNIMTGAYFGTEMMEDIFNLKYFSCLPMSHVFGFVRNLLTPFITHSSVYIASSFRRMFKEIEAYEPNIMVLVPAIMELIINVMERLSKDIFHQKLDSIIVGGAAIKTELVKKYLNRNIKVYPGYGMSETANLISGNTRADIKPTSVGVAFSGMDIKLVDGEIYVSGDNVMLGYYKDEKENENVFEDGYLKTGDLGYFDEDGYLYLTGRKNDLIILSNGENISPIYLENMINEIQGVQASCVYQKGDSLAVEIFPHFDKLKELSISDYEGYFKEKIIEFNQKVESWNRILSITYRESDFMRDANTNIIRGMKNEK